MLLEPSRGSGLPGRHSFITNANKLFFMRIFFAIACAVLACTACNNGNETKWPDRAIRDSVKNPLVTQPENESIPPDMHIARDSVIVPDSTGAPMQQH